MVWLVVSKIINWHYAYYPQDREGVSDFRIQVKVCSDEDSAKQKAHEMASIYGNVPFNNTGKYVLSNEKFDNVFKVWCSQVGPDDHGIDIEFLDSL